MTMEQEIQRFKIDMLSKMPFYGDIIMALPFKEDSSIPIAATDGTKIMYNPKFLQRQTRGQRNFILMHEVLHVLLLHCTRGREMDPRIANIAKDLIVNDILMQMMSGFSERGIPLEKPEYGYFAEIKKYETAENLYASIVSDNENRMKGGKLAGDRLALRDSYMWTNGKFKSHNIPSAESGMIGGDLMPGTLPKEQQEIQNREIKQLIAKALNTAKQRGEDGHILIPRECLQIVETKRLNWKRLFKNMLTDAQSEETSYATPERKYLHMDMILPGHGESEETLESVWAFVDCSGSVNQDEMNSFLTQLYRIIKEFHCTMHVAYWDTAVDNVYQNITSEKELLKAVPKHSGGTDINCVYRWIRENRVKPDCMLVLTDGFFGILNEDNFRLRRKTIVVLSKNSAEVNDNIRKVGKPASL